MENKDCRACTHYLEMGYCIARGIILDETKPLPACRDHLPKEMVISN